ncbi:hypothetical protein [Novosphingobium decolorationis]|uniref:Uncharacterized protein n=1 Tax=Novosphingobium decolorationis TaxID=2698673 RepID=A0ABX8E7W0_9SPHN|nr:hypothetical protein [Novosphingobium decolorationis]QVM85257.1 hypothetical protein HT578_17565 [Novosphingobium decolorationis]
MVDLVRSVTSIPFSERRYIAVLSDQEYDRRVGFTNKLKYGEIIVEAIPLILPGGPLVRVAGKFALDRIVQKANYSYSKGVSNAGGTVHLLPLREANLFKFLSGSAEVGRAYAVNPLCDNMYYSVDTYNDDMVDHKLSELERVLNALGATRYSISFQSEYSSSFDVSIDGQERKFFNRGAKAAFEAESRRARARRFERSGTSAGGEPTLPQDLVWLEREPSWEALVESRLHYGRKTFDLSVTLDRDLRMSAKVMADLKVLRLDMQAKVESRSSVTLYVSGEF